MRQGPLPIRLPRFTSQTPSSKWFVCRLSANIEMRDSKRQAGFPAGREMFHCSRTHANLNVAYTSHALEA